MDEHFLSYFIPFVPTFKGFVIFLKILDSILKINILIISMFK